MLSFKFFLFSPSGNTTLFLNTYPDTAEKRTKFSSLATEQIKAEQSAFIDIERKLLFMSGEEFCVNACRAFGALLDKESHGNNSCERGSRVYRIAASGTPSPVDLCVNGSAPIWEVKATFQFPALQPQQLTPHVNFIQLPGINHLLINSPFPNCEHIAESAHRMIKEYGLENDEATGVIWWEKKENLFKIYPFVTVPKAGTAMLETSCGSGSLALAYAQKELWGNQDFCVSQPGGEILSIHIEGTRCSVKGTVRTLSYGYMYLDV